MMESDRSKAKALGDMSVCEGFPVLLVDGEGFEPPTPAV